MWFDSLAKPLPREHDPVSLPGSRIKHWNKPQDCLSSEYKCLESCFKSLGFPALGLMTRISTAIVITIVLVRQCFS